MCSTCSVHLGWLAVPTLTRPVTGNMFPFVMEQGVEWTTAMALAV
jgi:hypothetical protein